MNNQLKGDPRLNHNAMISLAKMNPLMRLQLDRFEALMQTKHHYNQMFVKQKDKTENDIMEMSQMNAIADMMMECTIDSVGVKR